MHPFQVSGRSGEIPGLMDLRGGQGLALTSVALRPCGERYCHFTHTVHGSMDSQAIPLRFDVISRKQIAAPGYLDRNNLRTPAWIFGAGLSTFYGAMFSNSRNRKHEKSRGGFSGKRILGRENFSILRPVYYTDMTTCIRRCKHAKFAPFRQKFLTTFHPISFNARRLLERTNGSRCSKAGMTIA